MIAYPKRMAGRRPCFLLLCFFSLFASALCPAAAAGEVVAALQEIGGRIRQQLDEVKSGLPAAPAAVATLERQLRSLDAASSRDLLAREKYRAVAVLLGALQTEGASRGGVKESARVESAIVGRDRGDACEAALGLAENSSVRTSLAAAGERGSVAWFHFAPQTLGSFRFDTRSRAADPAIDVFSACTPGSQRLAANDDSFGLDASAVAATTMDSRQLFVRVTNTGVAGSVQLGVAAADATIKGRITDVSSGLPVTSALIYLYTSNGFFIATGYPAGDGTYAMVVSAGSYYVQVVADSYLEVLYPSASCGPLRYYGTLGDCQTAQAQAVSVASGATASNIDVALSAGLRIFGAIRDTASQPVGGSVYLYDTAGSPILQVTSDAFGRYAVDTLPPGSYKLHAQADGYSRQMFDHVTCSGPLHDVCDFSKAAVVTLGADDRANTDFELDPLAAIEGDVYGAGSVPIYPFGGTVTVLDPSGAIVTQTNTDSNGHYRGGPLAVGSYLAYASANGYFSQLFSAVDCGTDCFAQAASATPIVIAQDGQVATADFNLDTVPVVHGHVQDADSGAPLAGVAISTSVQPPSTAVITTVATTDGNGDYSITGTPAGQFYLSAQSPDHTDQVYPNIACEQFFSWSFAPCDVSGAVQLVIAPGQAPAAFNFSLHKSGSIAGSALQRADVPTDLPANVEIDVYNGSGTLVGSAETDALGGYVISDLPPATYYVAASIYSGYVGQVWHGADCPSQCVPTTGTPVVLAAGGSAAGIDFSLVRHNAIIGRVSDRLGEPVAGAVVDLFDVSSGARAGSGVSTMLGFYSVGSNYSGSSYAAATDAGPAFVDQVYSNVDCPDGPAYFGLCSLGSATPIPLNPSNTVPRVVNFALIRRDRVFGNGFEAP